MLIASLFSNLLYFRDVSRHLEKLHVHFLQRPII
jgi:hypothetical protein